METKKDPGADLSRKSGLFLGIGATIALSLIITAFEWKAYDPLVDIPAKVVDHYTELVVIPPTEILPPAPKPRPVVIVEVKSEDKTEIPHIDIDVSSETVVDPIPPFIELPVEPSDNIELFPEESASPMGGFSAFYKYVQANIKYPPQARRIGIEGRVFVEFVIGRDGILTDVKVIKGIGGLCDEEAARIVKSSPRWNPGKQRGKPVRQRYTLPIIFKLG